MQPDSFPPLHPGLSTLFHGGDWNPDQWLHDPKIIDEDFRVFPLAGIDSVSLGIFSWAALEPEEGRFEFGWMDAIMDRLEKAKMRVVLATPSGARPAWMAQKSPEVLRVNEDRKRILFGARHNHCPTSPVYRKKVAAINELLAKRYGAMDHVVMWHLSNEYGGECHCDLCQAEFRVWLKRRYVTLDALNHAWWNAFWSHTITDWAQIESPAPHGENSTHGHSLDWKRFITDRCIDFIKVESEPLRRISPKIPITTNLMGAYPGLDYRRLSESLDFVTWDNYPQWHNEGDPLRLAANIAFAHDLTRGFKQGRPFYLMESSPSATNWQPVGKLRRPGMHRLASLQAVAHGADSVQYFQYRKSRGASEKFHGAVIDHVGHEKTRVFGDVAQVGRDMKALADVAGSASLNEVAVIYDWETRWAVELSRGPRNDGLTNYEGEVKAHHEAFWRLGIGTDVIGQNDDLSGYRIVVGPMTYLLQKGFAEKVERFVEKGGVYVSTYLSGIADESDLVFLGGWPGPLRKVLGIWSEEIDAIYPNERNRLLPADAEFGLPKKEYEVRHFCDLIHCEGAETLATYGDDFYAGRPALTRNRFGKGEAFYLAARCDLDFLGDFFGSLASRLALRIERKESDPKGLQRVRRIKGAEATEFVMNWTSEPLTFESVEGSVDLLTGSKVSARVRLDAYGVAAFRSAR